MARKTRKRNTTKAKKPQGRRKTAKKPQKFDIKVFVDGRGRKALVEVSAENGDLLFTDRADLSDARERHRVAKRLAARLNGQSDALEVQLEQAYAKVHQQRTAEQAAAAESTSSSIPPIPPELCYVVEHGRICHKRYTREGGETLVPLCNFNAIVKEAVRVDDGSGEIQHNFIVAGELAGGGVLPPATVRATEFSAMNWPLTAWGLRAIVLAGQGLRDHLRIAIQHFSKDAPERTVYKHTGWRKENDEWVYLHGGGAIGAAGHLDGFSVELDGPLARFVLPQPPEGAELKSAVRASLRLRSLSDRLMSPILGAVYRAVLGGTDCSLHIVGHTGLGKSELIALAQQHFGPEMDRLHLPGNWLSTGNSLESLSFLVKDALLVIDDFKPGGSKSDIDRLHALADRVLRAQGNNSGRGRCRPDGSVRNPRPPRGMILSSGEDVPRGESLRARNLVLHVARGEFQLTTLTPHQKAAAQGVYAHAMSAFIRWLALRYEALRGQIAEERAKLRDQAMSKEGHARTPGIVADLALGWKYFLAFAMEAGVITNTERDEITKEVWEALLKSAAQQEAEIASQDSANRFLDQVASCVASGRAYVAGRDGDAPEAASTWGWRSEVVGGGDNAESRWRPQGKQIGWVDGDNLYLDPEASYAEVQRLGDEQGERLAVSPRQLHKHMKERGLLVSTESGKNVTRRTLQGRERCVLHFRADCLTPQKQGDQGEQGAPSEKAGQNPPVQTPYSENGRPKQGDKTGGFAREKSNDPPIPPVPPVSGSNREQPNEPGNVMRSGSLKPPPGAKLFFQTKDGHPCTASEAAIWTWEGAPAWYIVAVHSVPFVEHA